MNRLVPISSALSCRWSIEGILPNLPSPGTPAFSDLWAKLKPYGISPDGYTLDVPTSRLADVALTVRLLSDSVLVRISYSWLEVSAPQLWPGYEKPFVEIAKCLHANLRRIDDSLEFGRCTINAKSHAKLTESTAQSYLSNQLKSCVGVRSGKLGALTADGFAFNLVGETKVAIAVAKSVLHEDAIFLDLYCDYPPPLDPEVLADCFTDDYRAIVNLIDLDIMDGGERRSDASAVDD